MELALLLLTVALVLVPALVGGRISSDGTEHIRRHRRAAPATLRPRARESPAAAPRPGAEPSPFRRMLGRAARRARDAAALILTNHRHTTRRV